MHKKKVTEITEKDLPLFCPPKDQNFWAMHPRVFLEVAAGNKVSCPYCGSTYKFIAPHSN
ncbi:MAG: zinc-finger domain-containing protein [Methylophilales bacterium]|jgi:uncharacterized Zn-finger protein|nr:zinc-finger domain-containing protein [Pseudomonadota bacterium]NQW34324.1 zinc-finger domain-containing protein [Methylophilales bacterium]HCK04244.1 zinc-finger domain-containing protein [Methylophilaceae bacterium]